jgi:hypothetical protein
LNHSGWETVFGATPKTAIGMVAFPIKYWFAPTGNLHSSFFLLHFPLSLPENVNYAVKRVVGRSLLRRQNMGLRSTAPMPFFFPCDFVPFAPWR